MTYTIATFEIRITENFQSRARVLLLKKEIVSPTPLQLWKRVGMCFHVVYALGLDVSAHFLVYKLLGTVARTLVGAGKHTPGGTSPFF